MIRYNYFLAAEQFKNSFGAFIYSYVHATTSTLKQRERSIYNNQINWKWLKRIEVKCPQLKAYNLQKSNIEKKKNAKKHRE